MIPMSKYPLHFPLCTDNTVETVYLLTFVYLNIHHDMVVLWFAMPPHSKKVVVLPVWTVHALPVTLWFLSGFLPQIRNMHLRPIANSKLTVLLFVFLCDCVINWQLVQDGTLIDFNSPLNGWNYEYDTDDK